MSLTHITATGWDPLRGGTETCPVPRATADQVEALLGKRGTLNDRHTLAASDTVAKIARIRASLLRHNATWDAAAISFQWILRGVVSYCPLVGIPSPSDLHAGDAACQRLVISQMGIRRSAECVSSIAPFSCGGLQLPSCVECVVSSVAMDLSLLLNGTSLTSQVARDAVQAAMALPPETADDRHDLVCNAFRFLAGYGIYMETSTDRTVGRILDALQAQAGLTPQSMSDSYHKGSFSRCVRFCRIGKAANSIRHSIATLRLLEIAKPEWPQAPVWANTLDQIAVTADSISRAIHSALASSAQDWATETLLFRPNRSLHVPDEDWPVSAWEHPWSTGSDARSAYLDAPCPLLPSPSPHNDFMLYGDGGFHPVQGATFAAEPRYFGGAVDY